MREHLKKRIRDLKKFRSDINGKPELWHLIGTTERSIKINKRLYFDLYGIYEIGKRREKNCSR
jgi:hypothetical protein